MITLLHWGMPKLLQYYKVCVWGGLSGIPKVITLFMHDP